MERKSFQKYISIVKDCVDAKKSFQKYISIVKDCVDAKKAFILENIVDVKKLSKVKFC